MIALFDVILGASLLKFGFVSERASRGWRGFFWVSLLALFLGLCLVINRFAHSAGPWVASHMYHRFSCYEFCDQRHLDAHRTLPSGLCRLALLGSWPSLVDDNTREIVEQVKQHFGDL